MLEPGEVEVDVALFEGPGWVVTTDEEPERVRADLGDPLVETGGVLAVDGVEVEDPLGAVEAELEMTAVALEEVVAPEYPLEPRAVELTTGGPEETVVPKVIGETEELEIGRDDWRITLLEAEGIVAVLRWGKETLMLGGAIPLEVGTVVAITEGRTVTVVVIALKAVPEIIPST